MRDFVEDPRKEIWEIEIFGLSRLPTRSFTLQEVGILHTLAYFPFLARNGCMFEFLVERPLLRRIVLCLCEDMGLPQEEMSLFLSEGSVCLGKGVCLGEEMFA